MIILGIDTSTFYESISLYKDGKLIGEFHSQVRNHSPIIIKNIKNILTDNNLSVHDIDIWGVSIGPGSFTGLRIGLASVLGIILPLKNSKILGVSTLLAMAEVCETEGLLSPMIDARKGEIYSALYLKDKDKKISQVAEDTVISPEKWKDMIRDKKVTVFGTGADRYREVFEGNDKIFVKNKFDVPVSRGVVKVIERSDPKEFNSEYIEPVYIRLSEAEINYNLVIE